MSKKDRLATLSHKLNHHLQINYTIYMIGNNVVSLVYLNFSKDSSKRKICNISHQNVKDFQKRKVIKISKCHSNSILVVALILWNKVSCLSTAIETLRKPPSFSPVFPQLCSLGVTQLPPLTMTLSHKYQNQPPPSACPCQ